MSNEYLIVDKKLLPKCFEKVIEAKKLLKENKFDSVSKVCEPIMNVLKEYKIERCYYGHLHGGAINGAINNVFDGIKFQLVSADYLGFIPKKICEM